MPCHKFKVRFFLPCGSYKSTTRTHCVWRLGSFWICMQCPIIFLKEGMALLCLILSIVRPHNPWDYSAVTQTFAHRDTDEQKKNHRPVLCMIKGCRKYMPKIVIWECTGQSFQHCLTSKQGAIQSWVQQTWGILKLRAPTSIWEKCHPFYSVKVATDWLAVLYWWTIGSHSTSIYRVSMVGMKSAFLACKLPRSS